MCLGEHTEQCVKHSKLNINLKFIFTIVILIDVYVKLIYMYVYYFNINKFQMKYITNTATQAATLVWQNESSIQKHLVWS